MREAAPSRITCSMGMTINMGNFESLRIDIGLEDSQREGESVKAAHERVFNFVNKRLTEKVNIVREELAEGETKGGY